MFDFSLVEGCRLLAVSESVSGGVGCVLTVAFAALLLRGALRLFEAVTRACLTGIASSDCDGSSCLLRACLGIEPADVVCCDPSPSPERRVDRRGLEVEVSALADPAMALLVLSEDILDVLLLVRP